MHAREHAASRVPTGLATLRRSAVLALATFAALLTLVLPSPAFARPASTTGGTIATTGAGATSGTSAGRRNHRAEDARTPRSLSGRTTASATRGIPAAEVSSHAHVAGISHGGPVLTAALPSTLRGHCAGEAAGELASEPEWLQSAPAGAQGSRAPPTA